MSSLQEIAFVALGILLIVGIGLAIAADARRRAPVSDPEHPNAPDHHRRSGHQRKKDRAKAKAARRARRSNRPR
jgi:hypothetical protein